MRTHRLAVATLAAIALVVAQSPTASAQGLSGSLVGLAVDSGAPVHIESETLEIDEPTSVATFDGGVRVTQENMTLTTDQLVVSYSGAKAGNPTELRTIDAIGSVEVRIDNQKAKGDKAHYEFAEETVTLTGNVVLTQRTNILKGGRFVVNLQTRKAKMYSPGKRVRGTFAPNRR